MNKADILVSWNFKHIVNVYRIRGYNSINLIMNYLSLEIRSPKEILEYEDKKNNLKKSLTQSSLLE